jgi:uncharacterized protein YgbK (DUF1537 family)
LTRLYEPDAPVAAEECLASQPHALRMTDALKKIRDRVVQSGQRVVVYTSREVVGASGNLSGLEVRSAVSAELVEVMRRVDRHIPLSFVVAKRGITSGNVAAKGLSVRRAEVLGQMLPGIISVWVLPEESGYPGLPYVVFPGNVGGSDALVKVIEKLRIGLSADETDEAPDDRGGAR